MPTLLGVGIPCCCFRLPPWHAVGFALACLQHANFVFGEVREFFGSCDCPACEPAVAFEWHVNYLFVSAAPACD